MKTIAFVLIGIVLGFCFRKSLLPRAAEYAALVTVSILVFLLGAEAVHSLSWQSLTSMAYDIAIITFGACAGSILFVRLFVRSPGS